MANADKVQWKFMFARLCRWSMFASLPAFVLFAASGFFEGQDLVGTFVRATAILMTLGLGTFFIFLIRCSACGVSYYYDEGGGAMNDMHGINLMRPVSSTCRRCGKERKFGADGRWLNF